MLWPAPDGAIGVVVTEMPRFCWVDAAVATPAVDGSGSYAWRPVGSALVVVSRVPALLSCAACPVCLPRVFGAASRIRDEVRAVGGGADAHVVPACCGCDGLAIQCWPSIRMGLFMESV